MTATDLQRVAEVRAVREALREHLHAAASEPADDDLLKMGEHHMMCGLILLTARTGLADDEETALTEVAERLHAAGWRPGMTAEDAARLLAAQR